MDRLPAARGRAARLFAVLAVLLGLLAMHGLASAHHAAATAPVADHGATVAGEDPAAELPHEHPAVQHGAADAVSAASSALEAPSCHDDCPTAAALCVAFLAIAALALLLARQRPAVPRWAPTRRRTRPSAPPIWHGPGPDPVRELCVSRT